MFHCFLLILVLGLLLGRATPTGPPFSGCEVATYYAPLGVDFPTTGDLSNLESQLHGLISPHNAIPYSSSTQLDTSDALKVTDEDSNNPGFVFDVYRDTTIPATKYIGAPDFDGTSLAWSREHLWPNSK